MEYDCYKALCCPDCFEYLNMESIVNDGSYVFSFTCPYCKYHTPGCFDPVKAWKEARKVNNEMFDKYRTKENENV